MDLSYEIKELISGIGKNPAKDLIEAAAGYLGTSKRAVNNPERDGFLKAEETTRLVSWIDAHDLWCEIPDQSRYLTRGAEQRVYLDEDGRHVIKLNDAIF